MMEVRYKDQSFTCVTVSPIFVVHHRVGQIKKSLHLDWTNLCGRSGISTYMIHGRRRRRIPSK